MRGVFIAKETIEGKFMIGLSDELYNYVHTKIPTTEIKTYNILPARILGLSYAEYLRYCRDKHNGIIYGKDSLYPYVVFEKKEDMRELWFELNNRLKQI